MVESRVTGLITREPVHVLIVLLLCLVGGDLVAGREGGERGLSRKLDGDLAANATCPESRSLRPITGHRGRLAIRA